MTRKQKKTRGAGGKPRDRSGKTRKAGKTRVRARARWMKRILIFSVLSTILASCTLLGVYFYYANGLPDYRNLRDYQPPQITRIFARDKSVIGEFFTERRTLVSLDEIAEPIIQAVLSAEDADFYKHKGLDYMGMARALYKSIKAGRVKGGGSTITQQTVKNLLLTPERSFHRKIRELILARRLEKHLSKSDILTIYLNEIYLGHGRFGVQEAAQHYFGRDAHTLTVNHAAILAGLIASPERYSPLKHPKRARERRHYVLNQMVKNGYITAAQRTKLNKMGLDLRTTKRRRNADHRWFVDEVYERLTSRFSSDVVKKQGLKVYTTLDPIRQSAALESVRRGLKALDKRQRFGMPIKTISKRKSAAWVKARRKRLKNKVPRPGRSVQARVFNVTPKYYQVELGVGKAELDRNVLRRRYGDAPKFRYKVGDIIRVSLKSRGPKHPAVMKANLADIPQASFVVLDNESRDVLAMVGGWDYHTSNFNRVTQAKRQPGSAFKPFVWGAAIDSRRFTAASTLIDAPETLRVYQGRFWQPRNYTKRFSGPISLRKALANSVNSIAFNLAETIGVSAVHRFARKAGIRSNLAPGLAVALGGSEVISLNLVNSYATIADDGQYKSPRFITKIIGPNGELAPEQRVTAKKIPSDVAFVVRSMLRSVVTQGSAKGLKSLHRQVVGKTGTTNRARDAWFVGTLPDVSFAAWVGFDDGRPLGKKESGGRTAVPLVKAYLENAEKNGPDWPDAPDGVESRMIVADGRLAPEGAEGQREEFFLLGTEPREYAPAAGEVDGDSFFFERGSTKREEKPVEPKNEPNIALEPLEPLKAKTADVDLDLSPIAPKKPRPREATLDLSPLTPKTAKPVRAVRATAVVTSAGELLKKDPIPVDKKGSIRDQDDEDLPPTRPTDLKNPSDDDEDRPL